MTSARRSRLVPDTPTLHEAGLTGYDRSVWYGVIGPAGLFIRREVEQNIQLARVAGIRKE